MQSSDVRETAPSVVPPAPGSTCESESLVAKCSALPNVKVSQPPASLDHVVDLVAARWAEHRRLGWLPYHWSSCKKATWSWSWGVLTGSCSWACETKTDIPSNSQSVVDRQVVWQHPLPLLISCTVRSCFVISCTFRQVEFWWQHPKRFWAPLDYAVAKSVPCRNNQIVTQCSSNKRIMTLQSHRATVLKTRRRCCSTVSLQGWLESTPAQGYSCRITHTSPEYLRINMYKLKLCPAVPSKNISYPGTLVCYLPQLLPEAHDRNSLIQLIHFLGRSIQKCRWLAGPFPWDLSHGPKN